MEENKILYKEYIGLAGDRKNYGKKIESEIIPMVGKLLDYIEVMLQTLPISEEEYNRSFRAIRKKVLRDGNDCVRNLLLELHSYNMKKLQQDIIQFKN